MFGGGLPQLQPCRNVRDGAPKSEVASSIPAHHAGKTKFGQEATQRDPNSQVLFFGRLSATTFLFSLGGGTCMPNFQSLMRTKKGLWQGVVVKRARLEPP